MGFYEWDLQTSVPKFFAGEAGAEVPGMATTVRLSSSSADVPGARFFVRFFYGRFDGPAFVPAVRDDGIVIAGPDFYNLDLNMSEVELLQLCADIMKWDGQMRYVDSTPPGPGTP